MINVLRPEAVFSRSAEGTHRPSLLYPPANGIRYRFYYNCPQVILSNGLTMVYIEFHAVNQEDIKTCSCKMIISNNQNDAKKILNYSLTRGFHRAVAIHTNRDPTLVNLVVGGFQRRFQWYDGAPYFVVGGQSTFTHPGGWIREYETASGRWYWTTNPGHLMIYDTAQIVT
ncbi:hypothetical protein GQ43DRAFT_369422 [Delitschia confertaspora ATCC 74209]|uniref:Uncharacterized protein n=1 Tax=Delitschia confertaspora ATCC 74209 TaxID=1513339 RepID=A0A9P4MWL7_9PLEO|nr:hypothetical protein GQ43DRAFT_369422 [Delitschia confertaspora ATCC 74209]